MTEVHFLLNGARVPKEDLLKLELGRARRMMALLMSKLGSQGMADLFKAEIASHSKEERDWQLRSGGQYVESVAFAHVDEGTSTEFIEWFIAGYTGQNAPAMQRAHPEHLGAIPTPRGQIGIIEVPGHTESPAVLHLRVLDECKDVPIAVEPSMPHRMMGRFETAEGVPVGYLLHQFRDTSPGFDARLSVHWPAAAPEALVRGHVQHLMIEFNNWFLLYIDTRSQNVDLMPRALSCGL